MCPECKILTATGYSKAFGPANFPKTKSQQEEEQSIHPAQVLPTGKFKTAQKNSISQDTIRQKERVMKNKKTNH